MSFRFENGSDARFADWAQGMRPVVHGHDVVWRKTGGAASDHASVRQIAADLRDKQVTADELERAKLPRIDQLEKARETN